MRVTRSEVKRGRDICGRSAQACLSRLDDRGATRLPRAAPRARGRGGQGTVIVRARPFVPFVPVNSNRVRQSLSLALIAVC